MGTSPGGGLTRALREALRRWAARRRGRLAVAFSGGCDSAALGSLCVEEAGEGGAPGARPPPVALVVDHGLRPEARGEAARALALARSLGLEARLLRASPGGRSLPQGLQQRWARSERYRLLAGACQDLGVGTLLTGHHADDQVETFLLRLAAGSGLEGLAAMPEASWLLGGRAGPLSLEPAQESQQFAFPVELGNGSPPSAAPLPRLLLLRPLLGARKRDLESLCRARSVEWVADPTNADQMASRRNAVRAVLARAEAAGRPAPHDDILRVIKACAEDRDEIRSQAAAAVSAALDGNVPDWGLGVRAGSLEFYPSAVLREPEPVALRALSELLRAVSPPPPARFPLEAPRTTRSSALRGLLRALHRGVPFCAGGCELRPPPRPGHPALLRPLRLRRRARTRASPHSVVPLARTPSRPPCHAPAPA